MDASQHRDNANFLRELAESLPRILPERSTVQRIALLKCLADNELAKAEFIEATRAKVLTARADTPPPRMNSAAARESIRAGLKPSAE